MPSFDVVSEVDVHEVTNAVDQANREISNRFDFKGVNAKFEYAEDKIIITAPSDFQVKQMVPILEGKLAKRGVDVSCLAYDELQKNLHEAKQVATIRQGIDKEQAKKIVKHIKESTLKVQATVQDEKVRVTGKKRDDLQRIISILKDAKLGIPLQYVNFRD